jgi:GTP-binding protein
VAVVGRQNVGKSTLVNRLFGRRETIADERPGVTRDRIEVPVEWRGRAFTLIDTGGYLSRARGVEALVAEQAERAAGDADVVLLVVDASVGIVEDDASLARRLRRAPVPVLLVANKVDSERDEAEVPALLALGLGEPLAVSALHGRGSGDLLDRIVNLLPPEIEGEVDDTEEPRFALVGRPNVGKSSLFNRLVGEERSVVYEEAGTTRDAVDAIVTWPDGPARFVDTAGFRRPSRARGVDYYSFVRTERAIERTHVAVLVLDATDGFTAEDKRIARRVIDAGRALVLAANKWDLVEDKDRTFRGIEEQLGPFARARALRTSARTGRGIDRLPGVLVDLQARWSSRAPTHEVNRVLQDAQAERPAPRTFGRFPYGTQVSSGPPTFVLFGGAAPDPAYRRYLENRIRDAFGLEGVPIRLRFRARRRKGSRPTPS